MADDKKKDEDAPKPSGGGLMAILPLVVIAGAASFGMVWFATSPPPPVTPEMCEAVVVREEIPPEELQARAAKYIPLDPFTVSLGPDAGARHVMMTIALGAPADADPLTEVQRLRLRDQFLERLRTIDSHMITDPDAMPDLKSSLLLQAQATLGKDAVYSILVTEFLMK